MTGQKEATDWAVYLLLMGFIKHHKNYRQRMRTSEGFEKGNEGMNSDPNSYLSG